MQERTINNALLALRRQGAITRLEWVFAERVGNRMLPKGADKRYGKNHWVT